jgi:hypothetical protein
MSYNSDENEKMWNFLKFRIWTTNKELDEMSPLFSIVALLIVAIAVIIFVCHS